MIAKRRVYFFTTGINNFPGDAKNFTGRAVTHVQTHEDYRELHARAEKIEYLSTAMTRSWFEGMRAEKLARTAGNEFYRDADFEKIHVVHSNGGDVFCDAFEKNPALVCKRVHLVCPANNADFETNG